MGRDAPAVPQDGDPIGDAGDLLEAVADVNERYSLGAKLLDLREETLGLLAAERSGRLVEDEQLGVQREGLRDFDLLLRRHPKRSDEAGGRDVEAQAPELLLGLAIHLPAIDDSIAHRQPSHEHVLADGEVGEQPHLLMDETNARGDGVVG